MPDVSLEDEVLKIFAKEARKQGKSLATFLRDAGILTQYQEKQILKHEVRLFPGERYEE